MPSIQSLHTPTVRTWVNGETYTPGKQNQDDRNLKIGIEELNSVIADVEDHFADSTAPNAKPQGKLWYDTGNSILKVYHTANGTPVKLLDSATAYQQSLSTGGTATLKPMGAINKNTTQVSLVADGDYMTYTIPANSVDASGIVRMVSFGALTVGFRSWSFNGTSLLLGDSAIPPPKWCIKGFAVRSGSNCKMFGLNIYSDDTGGTASDIEQTTVVTDWTTAVISKIVGTGSAVGTQEIMLTNLII